MGRRYRLLPRAKNCLRPAVDTNAFLSHNSLETLYDIMNSELENCRIA